MHFAEARRAAWRMVLRRSEGVGVGLCDCNECCEQRPSTGEHERNALEPLPPLSRAAAAAHLQMGGGNVGAHGNYMGTHGNYMGYGVARTLAARPCRSSVFELPKWTKFERVLGSNTDGG